MELANGLSVDPEKFRRAVALIEDICDYGGAECLLNEILGMLFDEPSEDAKRLKHIASEVSKK